MTTVAFLGPAGTFSHEAALAVPDAVPIPHATVAEVFEAVSSGDADFGVVAMENTVEGPVFAMIDGLLASVDLVAISEVIIPITFDALTVQATSTDDPALTHAVAHPHGLAQVRNYLEQHGWRELAAESNAAACRDLQLNQVAFGAPICAQLYGRRVLARGVEDFPGASTRFLVLAPRRRARALHWRAVSANENRADARAAGCSMELAACGAQFALSGANSVPAGVSAYIPAWRTLLAVTPSATGPGVLARLTAQFGRRSINMSSLISRPLKAKTGQYVFVLTMDAAPWQPHSRALLADLLAEGDALKTLGIWRADPREETLGGVLPDSVPPGSVTGADSAEHLGAALLW